MNHLSTVTTTDDEALLRAVLANPADKAPRLVYADWLDERGDPRGEYLRLDLELSGSTHNGLVAANTLAKAEALRSTFDPGWVVGVSRGRCNNVWSITGIEANDQGHAAQAPQLTFPGWMEVESRLRNRGGFWELRMWFGAGNRRGDLMAGSWDSTTGCRVHGRVRGRALRAVDPDWSEPETEPGVIRVGCGERFRVRLSELIWAFKWAYYYRDFAPDVHWAGGPELFPHTYFNEFEARAAALDREEARIAGELRRLRALMERAGINPDTLK